DVSLLPWRQDSLPSSGKTDALLNKLDELVPSGRKILVFSQFTSYLALIRKLIAERFPSTPTFELTGKVKHRDLPVQNFQNADGSAVMLAGLKAGGVGVNMHAADYVFLMDPWWNPAAESQAIDRAHRIGRRNTVFVYRVLTIGTIEQRVRAMQIDKQETFEELIGSLDDRSDLVSHFKSLRELVALRDGN
ncbi:MAG: C-terminal helicase domain-containing protein, partial [Opitutales bacterium]